MTIKGLFLSFLPPTLITEVGEESLGSLVPRPSLSLAFAVTILEAGKKELVISLN